eukprot:Phypoly_transcript_04684.p1 GENE.Phypoly_transcript_04684~~Phypoly_transcript_04684.p1  ORF type:complete len:684 (+),score=130.68 Phypoly_transcript_04684:46-2097(+)
MATTLRTYSKRVPRTTTSFLGRVENGNADWDELDELISEGDASSSKGSSRGGKRKEDFTGKENAVNQSSNGETRPTKKVATPTKGTPTKNSSAISTPTKQKAPLTPHKNTPTKPTTPSTPKAAKTPTKSPKSPKTPTKSPKTPTKTPTKSPKSKVATPPSPAMLKHPSPGRRKEDTRALRDELEYLLDGIDSSESEIRRESIHKLALEFRKGINKGPIGQLLRVSDGADGGAGEAIIQRLVDILLLRWDRSFCKDKASYLFTAIILHALARDPANIPHLSRCQVILRDIVFSTLPTAQGNEIEKQAVALAVNCGAFVAQDDYTSIGGDKNEFQIAASMATRTLAALSFTRTISDSLRQEGIVDAVVQLVTKWVEKLPNPPPPSPPFSVTATSRNIPQIDVHALLDIKYSLIILENATFVNPANQGAILKNNCEVIRSIIKLVAVTREIIILPKSETESAPCVTLTGAATDCMIGCLKLMLNLTYDHHDACESVRLACAEIPSTKNAKPTKNNKKSKKNPTNEDKKTETGESMPLGGLAVVLSLLNIQFDEDMFDIHQHVIGLLINLVETNPLNRQQIGSIDGAIAKIVSLYIAQKSAEEQRTNKHSNVGIVGAAYCAMLLGWLAYETPANEKLLRDSLPSECTFASLAAILKLFMSFQLQAGILPEDVQKSLTTVITLFESVQ